MGTVEDMAARVAKLGQPALALTDHGVMAGGIRLYKECMKQGIAPFPGEEFYLVPDIDAHREHNGDRKNKDSKQPRYHVGMLALDHVGYKALVELSSRSWTAPRFYYKPLIDFQDLADLSKKAGDHVALTTGCYFGLVVQTLVTKGSKKAKRVVEMYAKWFPHTYVGIQNHNVVHKHEAAHYGNDEEVSEALLDIADELGLPIVFGQDSHYCEASDQPIHDLMKDVAYRGDSDDLHYPGGPYHLGSTKWLRKRSTVSWSRIEEGHADLL
ncbi:MAG: PHP domain-containing protein, partial [Planctomycetes bacterium]|nr:PHP domain-containing protein [Planctomycetota bacterium]